MANLPKDPKRLNSALKLINMIMSEEAIALWLKKSEKQLECENPRRKEFEKQLQKIQNKLK